MHQRSSRCAQALLAGVLNLFALSAATDAFAEDFRADLAPDTELLSFAERQALAVLPVGAIRSQNQRTGLFRGYCQCHCIYHTGSLLTGSGSFGPY